MPVVPAIRDAQTGRRPHRRVGPSLSWIFAAVLAGCGRGEDDRLVIATAWPAPLRARIEAALLARPTPVRVRWLRVSEPDDPTRAAERGRAVDVVLGGSPGRFARLALRGRLQPIVVGEARPWRLIARPSDAAPSGSAAPPRSADPPDYEEAVRSFAEGKPEASVTSEAMGFVAGSQRHEGAAALLATLGGGGPASPFPSLADDLIAAATLDGRPELLTAREALARVGDPARPRAWMTEPPPWPPASIARMRAEPDGEALITTLAEQVAPDPEARAWLLASFNRRPRPIDASVLDELDAAAGGRLAAEPRFRAWVRSEWAAWARQRYRRVARNPDGARFAAP